MKTWGLCFGPAWQTSIADLVSPAQAAEEAGFDRIATGEFRNDAITWMAAVAAATRRIPVASTIASIALRHPSIVAEGVAALRDLYGDRIELGLGVSHRSLVSDDLGLDQPSLADLEAYVMAVRSVLSGAALPGERFRVPAHERQRIEPGLPPIHVSALGEVAARRAASYADGVILTWSPVEWTRRITAAVREEDTRSGRNTRVWVVLPTFANNDVDVARQACARHIRPYLRLASYRRMLNASIGDSERLDRATSQEITDVAAADVLGSVLIESVAAVGTRPDVVAAIERTAEAGADAIILYPLDTDSGWRGAVATTIADLAPPG